MTEDTCPGVNLGNMLVYLNPVLFKIAQKYEAQGAFASLKMPAGLEREIMAEVSRGQEALRELRKYGMSREDIAASLRAHVKLCPACMRVYTDFINEKVQESGAVPPELFEKARQIDKKYLGLNQ